MELCTLYILLNIKYLAIYNILNYTFDFVKTEILNCIFLLNII